MLKPPKADTPLETLGHTAREWVEAGRAAEYVREYNAGWAASGRGSDSSKWNDGSASWAWDDGYLDRASRDNDKWHLTYCLNHHNGEGGCGKA